jgi:murein DD-endopeptidase MepM/ murein hydrolase activator NlpD
VPAEVPQTLTWDGTAGGRIQRPGRYSFRVAADVAGARAVTAQGDTEPDPAAFDFLGHVFPVRGPHGYGELAASFGGGRGHQGQDVFAACGTPLVAARGGIVAFKQYHSRAGHYLVIDGVRTGVDYGYMHLRDAPLVDVGDRVHTGQLIGYVGQTGRASGCHLHLELWSAPGWYDGGRPFDPLSSLLSWDRRS